MRRLLFCLILLCPLAVQAEEKPAVTVAVMEFTSKGGVTQEQMDALGDMVANQIRGMSDYEVIGKSDIRAALQLEQQKQMLGCDNESCMAEIGGALGVRWMVLGNISLFGKTFLLNLKLLDVERVKVAQGLSKTIKGGEDALVEAVPAAVMELMAAAHKDLTGEKATEPEADKTRPKPQTLPGTSPEPTTSPVVEKNEWFTFPDPEGAFVRGTVGALAGFTGQGVTEGYSPHSSHLEATRDGVLFGVEAGYALSRWLKTYGRLGGYVTASTDDGKTRLRQAFELGVGADLALPINSWALPLIYTTVGLSFMSELEAGEEADLKAAGILWDLGLGVDLYLNPHWHVGLRVGVAIRANLGHEVRNESGEMENTDVLKANLVGGFVGLSSGYQF